MNIDETFEVLWQHYSEITPSSQKIKNLFESKGEQVMNDHIALRTFNDPRVNIEKLAAPFIALGYVPKDVYHFEQKKLKAQHYEHPDASRPKVFISELILEKCSPELQKEIQVLLDSVEANRFSEGLIFSGRIWGQPSFGLYEQLRAESEYAAWMYLYGFVVNHFTVSINDLKHFDCIESVNQFLKDNGYQLNSSGGEIKGTPTDLLQQSSTLADRVLYDFTEGQYEVPSCYYEFAFRYPLHGKLFTGFIAQSADKIFESTDKSLQVK
ncbi:MAG: DUF1338 domain-containing protein [Cyclobacteriaceae bacterium]